GFEVVRLDTEDAIQLIGPGHDVSDDIPLPAPHPRQLFELAEPSCAVAQRCPEIGDLVGRHHPACSPRLIGLPPCYPNGRHETRADTTNTPPPSLGGVVPLRSVSAPGVLAPTR